MATILIVDDRAINREALCSLLDERGYIVLEAEDGVFAIELARAQKVDLIISDIAMPRMDGLALAKQLQLDDALKNIPLIFYSATYKAAEAYRRVSSANVKQVLTKPCHPEIILATIEGVLDANTVLFSHKAVRVSENQKIEQRKKRHLEPVKKDKFENINLRLINLIEIGLDMSLEQDIKKLISILCKGGRQLLDAYYAGVIMVEANDLKQHENFTVDHDGKLVSHQFQGKNLPELLEKIFLSEKPIIIHSPIIDIERIGLKDIALPFSSILSLPLKTSRSFYGKIYFINKFNQNIFSPSDQRFMMTLSYKFAICYENLILRQEQVQAEEQSRAYQKQIAETIRSNSLGEMASSLAHEINQPLAAISAYIKGCVRRLEIKNEVTPEIIQILNEVNKQAERAGEVVHRIKNYVRKGELFYEKTDISVVVSRAIHLIKQEIQNLAVELIYMPNKALSTVKIDKIQIEQVILNLLRNGIEAMQEANTSHPKITIEVDSKKNSYVTVRVLDNGPGFSEKIAHHLFDMYFTTKPQGMGLGLAICRSIIEAHSGQLSASLLPQGGSCFEFDLPIKAKSIRLSSLCVK